MKRIAIYGKGGIGKSTVVTNLSAALAESGLSVMQIGCDPKSDSTVGLQNGNMIPTVMRRILENRENTCLEDIVFRGDFGVACVEAGGPRPGMGCAGRGIISAFEKLEELRAFEVYQPDVVLYDVLGDVVCGGFALPIRKGYAQSVCIVTSGEKMSLYAAGNILEAVRAFGTRGYASVGGLIVNRKNIPNEEEIVQSWAREHAVEILGIIPRSPLVQQAEERCSNVMRQFPDSPLADAFRVLAQAVTREREADHGI